MIAIGCEMIPKPTEITEQRMNLNNRPGKTVEEIRYDWEQQSLRAKQNLNPLKRFKLEAAE